MKNIFLLITLFFVVNSTAQQTVGVFLNEEASAGGYTLFGNNETTYLIDNCGLVVNSWVSNFKPGQSKYLLENGNLLQAVRVNGNFSDGGTGGRFELYNWNGELIWYHEYFEDDLHAHHDIAPLPNGNFLFTSWEKHTEAEAKQAGRIYDGPVWSEKIVEMKMLNENDANIVWEWRLWDHLIQDVDPALDNYGVIADHPELVDINYIGADGETSGNWIHLNSIDYHPELDQIMVSSRLFNEIWIIDHNTSIIEAGQHQGGVHNRGGDLLYRFGNPQTFDDGGSEDQLFFHQHDARWIPTGMSHSGKIMIFNNDFLDNQSRVEIWDTPLNESGSYDFDSTSGTGPDQPVWQFTQDGFYSQYMSGSQMLPNGNILICEGMTGHFFEMTSSKEMVWEYINPVNRNGGPVSQGGSVHFNQTFRATRYMKDYPAFENREFQGSIPVEINPWESDCFTFDDLPPAPEIKVLKNPFIETLEIESNLDTEVLAFVYDLHGRMLLKIAIGYGLNQIDLSGLPSGLYIVDYQDSIRDFPSVKVVKF